MATTPPSLQARFEGCILGLAIGDALGWPTEFLSVSEIRRRWGPAGVTEFVTLGRHRPGTYTDDTQMTITVAEALIEAGHGTLDELMTTMARNFVAWMESDENDRAPGNTCMAGCRNLARGVPWREAGIPTSKGCGSAMRAAPIGLYFWNDQPRLIEAAIASSMLTHRHPTALAAAAAAALLVAWAVRGDDPADYPPRLAAAMDRLPGGEEVAGLVKRVPAMLRIEPDDALCRDGLGEAWVGDEAVASALYCVCRSPRDYRATVLTAINTSGDSDTIGCIAGAISGALNGVDAIPAAWRRDVENAETLVDLANQLCTAVPHAP